MSREGRSDPLPDRLLSVSGNNLGLDSERIGNGNKSGGQSVGGLLAANFGCRAHRKIQDEMVKPAAIFFDSTDAIICPSESISSARPTRMRMSSAGLSLIAPPQTMHPPCSSTTLWMSAAASSTGAIVPVVSAVPAGEVRAREDVFGIVSPSAAVTGAVIGAMIGVVRFRA